MYRQAIKYGFIYGLAGIIITLLFYAMGVDFMSKWWVSIILFLLLITVVVIISFQFRKSMGGFISFKDAFAGVLIICIIGGACSTLLQIVLYNVIDPGFSQKFTEALTRNTVSFMESMGAPQEKIDETIENFESMPDRFTVANQLKSFLWSIFISAIPALIIAAIIKKRAPVTDQQTGEQV